MARTMTWPQVAYYVGFFLWLVTFYRTERTRRRLEKDRAKFRAAADSFFRLGDERSAYLDEAVRELTRLAANMAEQHPEDMQLAELVATLRARYPEQHH